MNRLFWLLFILFFSCKDGKSNLNSTENLNAITSQSLIEELGKYLERADAVTNKGVKEIHLIFYENRNDCLFEINYEDHSYNYEKVKPNAGHLNIAGKTVFFHGLNLPCSKDFVNAKLLNWERTTIERSNKFYEHENDLFQLYLVTEKGKCRRLSKT